MNCNSIVPSRLYAAVAGLSLSAAAAGFPAVLTGQDAPERHPSPAATPIHDFMSRAASYGQFDGAILVVDRGRTVYEGAPRWVDLAGLRSGSKGRHNTLLPLRGPQVNSKALGSNGPAPKRRGT